MSQYIEFKIERIHSNSEQIHSNLECYIIPVIINKIKVASQLRTSNSKILGRDRFQYQIPIYSLEQFSSRLEWFTSTRQIRYTVSLSALLLIPQHARKQSAKARRGPALQLSWVQTNEAENLSPGAKCIFAQFPSCISVIDMTSRRVMRGTHWLLPPPHLVSSTVSISQSLNTE